MTIKQTLTIALLLAALAFIISLVYKPLAVSIGESALYEQSSPTVELGGQIVRVTIADTSVEREKGLGGREGLARDEGMLFVFPEDGINSFWMKDMTFAIDILWISNSGEIVDIRESVAPESYPEVLTPRREARYVLELSSGWVEEYSLRIGDVVRL